MLLFTLCLTGIAAFGDKDEPIPASKFNVRHSLAASGQDGKELKLTQRGVRFNISDKDHLFPISEKEVRDTVYPEKQEQEMEPKTETTASESDEVDDKVGGASASSSLVSDEEDDDDDRLTTTR